MMTKNEYFRYKWTIAGLVILIVSIVLYAIFYENVIVQAFASALLSVSVVILVQENLLKNYLYKTIIHFQENGFVDINANRDYDMIKKAIKKSKNEIKMSGISLYVPMSNYGEEIKNLINKNNKIKIKILIVDPSSDIIQFWENNIGISKIISEESQTVITIINNMIEYCKKMEFRGEIELKTHVGLPFNCMYIFDRREIFYNPYINGLGGAKTPCFKIVDVSDNFDKYNDSFDCLWFKEDSKTISKYQFNDLSNNGMCS